MEVEWQRDEDARVRYDDITSLRAKRDNLPS
jgi:hypothetical protein